MFNFINRTKESIQELQVTLQTIEASQDYALKKELSDRDYAIKVGLDKFGICQKALKPKLLHLLINPALNKNLSQLARNEGINQDSLLVELTYALEGFENVNKDISFIDIEQSNNNLRTNLSQSINFPTCSRN